MSKEDYNRTQTWALIVSAMENIPVYSAAETEYLIVN
jgi:hypothetical protein